MSVLADSQIRELCMYRDADKNGKWQMRVDDAMIEPFVQESIKSIGDLPIPSYGVSSYGYDLRLGGEFKIFTNVNNAIIDPMNFSDNIFVDVNKNVGEYIIIPPNSFVLAVSVEYIRMPKDVLAICLGKSTYARCGIICNVTPIEPGWEGHITLEFSNTTTLPAKMYVGAGCAQLIFHKGDVPCEVTYAMRGGKYQGQLGVTLPK